MNIETTFVPRHGASASSAQVTRMTGVNLAYTPFNKQLPISPEPGRTADRQYKSVTQPTVAKPVEKSRIVTLQVYGRDQNQASDELQDAMRKLWIKGIPDSQRVPVREVKSHYKPLASAAIVAFCLKHLRQHDDTREGITAACGKSQSAVNLALAELRDKGMIYAHRQHRTYIYAVTP